MKRRVLKPVVEKVLTFVVVLQLIMICSLEDFELSAIPFILAFVALLIFNTTILVKYSRNPLTD